MGLGNPAWSRNSSPTFIIRAACLHVTSEVCVLFSFTDIIPWIWSWGSAQHQRFRSWEQQSFFFFFFRSPDFCTDTHTRSLFRSVDALRLRFCFLAVIVHLRRRYGWSRSRWTPSPGRNMTADSPGINHRGSFPSYYKWLYYRALYRKINASECQVGWPIVSCDLIGHRSCCPGAGWPCCIGQAVFPARFNNLSHAPGLIE